MQHCPQACAGAAGLGLLLQQLHPAPAFKCKSLARFMLQAIQLGCSAATKAARETWTMLRGFLPCPCLRVRQVNHKQRMAGLHGNREWLVSVSLKGVLTHLASKTRMIGLIRTLHASHHILLNRHLTFDSLANGSCIMHAVSHFQRPYQQCNGQETNDHWRYDCQRFHSRSHKSAS